VSDPVRVFVNAQMVELPVGATAAEAIGLVDQALLERVVTGAAFITDGRGIALDPAATLQSGAIIRVGLRAKSRSADADS
jgi:hypothetical protein